MTSDEFGVILEQRIVDMRRVLETKAGEYASSSDRLHNFKTAAQLFPRNPHGHGESPQEALLGMMRKHWVSIADMVSGTAHNIVYSDGLIDEKIGDAVNYLILLEAILKEKPKTPNPTHTTENRV
jgi:hypothetical protein